MISLRTFEYRCSVHLDRLTVQNHLLFDIEKAAIQRHAKTTEIRNGELIIEGSSARSVDFFRGVHELRIAVSPESRRQLLLKLRMPSPLLAMLVSGLWFAVAAAAFIQLSSSIHRFEQILIVVAAVGLTLLAGLVHSVFALTNVIRIEAFIISVANDYFSELANCEARTKVKLDYE